MKISIRQSVFETNSSSTHSLAYGYKSDISKFIEGKLLIIIPIKNSDIKIYDANTKIVLNDTELEKLTSGILFSNKYYKISIFEDLCHGELKFSELNCEIPKGYIAFNFDSILELNSLEFDVNDININNLTISTICFYGREG